ncbi:hypothetical protein [Gulosibacter sp. 10]|uniref:hypothetical protein n=1 Tax=Gulosibacter sp. 10 TaxID=1255570 RepID=UPI00097F5059|nr:hypothetical protein [Gulosibacter sp. 10]SJM59342.1 hypothetical protein FM112_06420 [Gulosibacter sp. 10]
MNKKKLWALLGIGALGLSLAACSSDEGEDAEEAPVAEETEAEQEAPETEEETPAEDDAVEDEGGSAPAGDVTAPGTELAFGETAVVEFYYAGESGLVEITPVGITKGDPADMADFDDPQMEGITPYYIEVEFAPADDAAVAMGSLNVNGALDALYEDGETANLVTVIGSWDKCKSESGSSDAAVGDTTTTCVPGFSNNDSQAVTGLQFDSRETDYEENPVVWTE